MAGAIKTTRGRPRDPALTARRREEILATAARFFAQRGYPTTDLQALADALGVGKGTIYRYFPSKERLFLAAVDRAMRCLRECVDSARGGASDPLDQIKRAMCAYLGFFDARPEFVELLIQERAVFRNRKKPTYFEHREAAVGRWRNLFATLIASGRVRRMSTGQITDVLSDALYGTMFTNFFAGRRKSFEAQARQILDIVFSGILTDEERARRLTAAGAEEIKT